MPLALLKEFDYPPKKWFYIKRPNLINWNRDSEEHANEITEITERNCQGL